MTPCWSMGNAEKLNEAFNPETKQDAFYKLCAQQSGRVLTRRAKGRSQAPNVVCKPAQPVAQGQVGSEKAPTSGRQALRFTARRRSVRPDIGADAWAVPSFLTVSF